MQKAFIGIDPGITGCAALINVSQNAGKMRCEYFDWSGIAPARQILYEWNDKFNICQIGLEEPAHLPHRSGFYGVKGLWRNVGQWEAILTCSGFRWVFIKPQVWRKVIPKRRGKNTKLSSFEFVRMAFPDQGRHIFLKKHHNRAEALIIAIYLREFDRIRSKRIQ